MIMVDQETKEMLKKAFWGGNLRVESVDPKTKEVGLSRVSDVMKHHTPSKKIVALELEDGRKVETTEDHSLFQENGEGGVSPTEAGQLQVGDSIVTVEEGKVSLVKIVHIETLPPEEYTYDFCVPGPENFVLTNGLLAHNSYSIGGVSLDMEKSSKYESAYQASSDQFEKQLEQAKATIKIVKGLQQPRFGVGIRSAFGPYTGAGILNPRKFIGF